MKKLLSFLVISFFLYSCGGPGEANKKVEESPAQTEKTADGNPTYDPNRGEGKFKDLVISEKLDAAMAASGEKVYTVKCAGCHKLTDERLVGPGWKGVTLRHTPEWILNFSTNTDEMLDKDPKAQAQLEICLVRMPNQNLSDDEAMHVYEFMRKNDGVK